MKIFLDAGHNDAKFDTGAEGFGLREQDVTFAISKLLGEKLKRVGIDVKYSRNNKTDIVGKDYNDSLYERAKLSNMCGSQLFLSIHTNSSDKPSANGTEVYVYNFNSSSVSLAEKIQHNIVNDLGTCDRGIKEANFVVLRCTNAPAILIEIAFISNASDNKKLKTKQEEIAEAIFKAICEEYDITTKKYESAEEITDKLSEMIEITDKATAVKQIQRAKDENNSLYWILYKLVNR